MPQFTPLWHKIKKNPILQAWGPGKASTPRYVAEAHVSRAEDPFLALLPRTDICQALGQPAVEGQIVPNSCHFNEVLNALGKGGIEWK